MKLKLYITVCLTLLLALMLAPFTSQARYLNPATGRFWTMDSFGGDEEEPPSLHKYLYCQANPVNQSDPSGHWSTLACLPIHQMAIDDVLSFLPDQDRSWLHDAQVFVDKFQSADASYMHAMRDGDADQSVSDAQGTANFFVRSHLNRARFARHRDNTKRAMEELGQAMHTLQDSASPVHHGFRAWHNYPGGFANTAEWMHGGREGINPGPGSWLYRATRIAYDYYTSESPLPNDFFASLGVDTVGRQISALAKRYVKSIPRSAADLLSSQLSLPMFGF